MAAYANTDMDPDPRDDTSLERIAPGEALELPYTVAVERKSDGLLPGDMQKLKDGETYEVVLPREQKWLWMFESDVPPDCSVQERGGLLRQQRRCSWRPDCVVEFEMVE